MMFRAPLRFAVFASFRHVAVASMLNNLSKKFLQTASLAAVVGCFAMASVAAFAQSPTTGFPATKVGQASLTTAVTVKVTTSGQAMAVSAMTQGVAGVDFAVAPGGTCATGTTYAPGDVCTVNVVFQPKSPGQRSGAVVLKGSSGAALGTGLLVGVGVGPLAVLNPGNIDTVVGNGAWIYRGDNVLATTAPIFLPMGIVVDAAGNIFLSDSSNNRLRRVDGVTGIITTVAGNGTPGFAGDGGAATQAEISAPSGIVLDGAGNLFFTDTGNHCVRRVDAFTGIITTVAGTAGVQGFGGDGGAATAAKLSLPEGLTFDAAGNLYIADTGNNAVREVDALTAKIRTIAGTGTGSYNGDNRVATTATLNSPWSVIVAQDNSIYIADLSNARVRKIDVAGVITTVTGNGSKGASGDGGPATAAQVDAPAALALDPAGNLYIADSGNNRVRRINATTGFMETITGTGSAAFTGDAGPANIATIYGPYALYFDNGGNLFLADMFHNRVRRISATAVTLTFPAIRATKVSVPQSEALENDGNATLTLGQDLFVNAALDPKTTCGSAPIAADRNCELDVEFAPATVGNPVLGTVTVPSDASNSPNVVTVTGQALSVNPTSVTLSSSVNPSLVGASVVFTATVLSADPTLSGAVVFLDGTTQLCSSSLNVAGQATCTTTSLTLGQHNITANYAGDANNASSVSSVLIQVVKQATTVVFTALPNPAVVTSTVTLNATASAATGTPTGTITFYDGVNAIGTVAVNASGFGTMSTSTLTPGTHALTAQYGGDATDAVGTSAIVSELISQATTLTTLASSNSSVVVGTSVTFTATVSTSGPSPTGTVQFKDGGVLLGSSALAANGLAVFATSRADSGDSCDYGGVWRRYE